MLEDINYINLFDLKITTNSQEVVLEKIEKYVKNSEFSIQNSAFKPQKPLTIFSVNPEIIMFAQKNQLFKKIVNTGQINIPDGVGVVWAANTLGQPIKKRISGADLVEKLSALTVKQHVVVGLIGGFDKIALKALECLKRQNPGLLGWAENGPEVKLKIKNERLKMDYGSWKIEDFIKRVKARDTKVLLVGFGYPKQELFIEEIYRQLSDIVIVAVGGSFDYYSGKIRRAPKIIQNIGLEWLYRLLIQPGRIKRQLAIPQFITLVLKEKYLH